MKTTIISALFLIIQFSSSAQAISKKDLCKEWQINKGWFGDETITLELLDKVKQKNLIEILMFKSDGSLSQELYNPQHLGMCGNGMLYFESATWRLDTNSIVFDVKGGRFAESTFHYIMTYSITSSVNNKLILKKKDVQMNEEKKYD